MLLGVNPLVLCIISLKEGFCGAGNNQRELNLVKRVAGVIKLMCMLQHGNILKLKSRKLPISTPEKPKTNPNQKNPTQIASEVLVWRQT